MGIFTGTIRKNKVEQIDAIHQSETEEYLSSIGLLEDLNEGNLSCKNCGDDLNIDNIGLMRRSEGDLILCCDKFRCIEACQG